jgi:hypothetical protein
VTRGPSRRSLLAAAGLASAGGCLGPFDGDPDSATRRPSPATGTADPTTALAPGASHVVDGVAVTVERAVATDEVELADGTPLVPREGRIVLVRVVVENRRDRGQTPPALDRFVLRADGGRDPYGTAGLDAGSELVAPVEGGLYVGARLAASERRPGWLIFTAPGGVDPTLALADADGATVATWALPLG